MKHALLAAVAIFLAAPAAAQTDADTNADQATGAEAGPAALGATATATLKAADGTDRGTVTLTQTNTGVLVRAELTGLPAGGHGFHFHENGTCEPDFEAAGGHYNPTSASHGFLAEGGPHVGDMPNVHVPDSGDLTVEHLNAFVSLSPESGNTLFDENGTAVIVHGGTDDYESQPSGDAGERIACGVVEQ